MNYPVHLKFQEYLSAKGFQNSTSLQAAEAKWGLNRFDIPLPSFWELYKEQAVAPFFVFQVFCVLLWCLDEYWYYSLFTLFLLLVFEATVVKSVCMIFHNLTHKRIHNLKCLPDIGSSLNRQIYVYRENRWVLIHATKLLPGDICSLAPPSTKNPQDATKEFICPCDMVLINGSCVVNEAMLTGESTPHLKVKILKQKFTGLGVSRQLFERAPR